ncbi:heptaprenyl diphosphate synthase [bacterium]|nr:heptaprenyl diphosphate synthase [bacterium]
MPWRDKQGGSSFLSYRRLTRIALWTAVGVVLAAVEHWLPSPLPWIRLGIANIAGLLALLGLGIGSAYMVSLLRVVLVGVLLGTLGTPAFLLSSGGAVGAVTVMALLSLVPSHIIGPVGLSVAGAWTHMTVQFTLVSLLVVRDPALFALAGPSLIAAVAAGTLVGWIVALLWRKLPARLVYLS